MYELKITSINADSWLLDSVSSLLRCLGINNVVKTSYKLQIAYITCHAATKLLHPLQSVELGVIL